jgi:DNA-directed RNA polymerase subunit K/omega
MTSMMLRRSPTNGYEFAVVSALRAHQLIKGCTPRLGGEHKATTMAQMEVAAGKVARLPDGPLLQAI